MKSLNLKTLFIIVAIVELLYALTGALTPPNKVTAVTGWVLTSDGQWILKLFSMALFAQAWVAWTLRNEPHIGIAKALAFYQFASATVDWVLWISLADDGIFATSNKAMIVGAIGSHYLIGILLVVAIRRESRKSLIPSAKPVTL